jgi:hypothetical protein
MAQVRLTQQPEPDEGIPPLPAERVPRLPSDAIPELDEDEPPTLPADDIPQLPDQSEAESANAGARRNAETKEIVFADQSECAAR